MLIKKSISWPTTLAILSLRSRIKILNLLRKLRPKVINVLRKLRPPYIKKALLY